MNNDFIFQPPPIPPNPLAEIAKRLDGQDSLNQKTAELQKELVATLKEVVQQQRAMSEQLAKVAQWIDLKQQ